MGSGLSRKMQFRVDKYSLLQAVSSVHTRASLASKFAHWSPNEDLWAACCSRFRNSQCERTPVTEHPSHWEIGPWTHCPWTLPLVAHSNSTCTHMLQSPIVVIVPITHDIMMKIYNFFLPSSPQKTFSCPPTNSLNTVSRLG